MNPFALRKNWPVLTILLCAAMLALLAGLQFTWTGQVSQAQASMMQTALANSIRQFEQEIGRELMYLLVLFQPGGRDARSEIWDHYAESFAVWSETSSHPKLLQRLLVYSVDGDQHWSLRELPLGENRSVEASWDGELASVRDSLENADRGPIGRDSRGPVWRLIPAARAIVRPLPPFDRPRRNPNRPPRFTPTGHLILVLDWTYVTESILPDFVQRFFAGPGGERLYEVAILTRGGDRFLYSSDDSIDSAWLARADIHRRLRLLREFPSRGPGPPGPLDPLRRLAIDSPRGNRPREPEGPSQRGRRLLSLGRERISIVGNRLPVDLEIAASHVSGSLAGVVDRQRARNLATGLGVLLLLGGAMALVVVSARRASQLAGMQMEFIAGVTHELRTPLSVICSVGENLADGVVGAGHHAKRYGELIRDQGQRLTEMVEQTLQLASMESRNRNLNLAPLDATEALQTALDHARPMIDQAGFSLERGERHDLPMVRADAKAVQQILANLLSNAVKYGEPGRWVRVETSTAGQGAGAEVQIRVLDRGTGILAKDADRIFDAFYRGTETAEKNIRGSGLGLKLARELALGMGGNLSFRSEPGQGSAFTLRLPAQPETSA